MKKSIFLSLLFLISIGNTAITQSSKNSIERDVNQLLNAVSSGEFDRIVEFINPAHFDVVSKAKMKRQISKMKSKTMEGEFTGHRIKNITEPIEHDNVKYALVDFEHDQEIKMLTPLTDEERKQIGDAYDGMIGPENWEWQGNVLKFTASRRFIGNLPPDAEHWTFVYFDEKITKEVEKKVTPIAVRKQLNLK